MEPKDGGGFCGHGNLQFAAKSDRSVGNLGIYYLRLVSELGAEGQSYGTEPLTCRVYTKGSILTPGNWCQKILTEFNCRTPS